MNYNNQEIVKTILDAVKEKDILKDVLTTPGAIKNEKLGSKYTHTPLSLAINYNKQEIIEVILVAAREQGILEKVLTTADIVEVFQNGKKHTIHTVTPLNFAIQRENHKSIKAILDAAKEQGILKEVFAGIEKGDLEKIKTIAKKAGDQDILDKILEVEKSISENEAMKRNPPTDGSATQSLKNKAKTINKPIIIGGVCGAIAALAVGVGCGVAGVQLSVLAIVGIAVAAALAVGIVAGVITYAVLKT